MSKTFKQTAQLDPSVLMIVDCINLGFRWKHSGQAVFLEDYQKTVTSLRQSYSAGKVVLACDQGSSKYRKNLFPEYKANREALREEQTEEEAIAFERFFKEFNRTMEAYKQEDLYPLFRFMD